MDDFNVDLSKYEQHSTTNEFLDSLASSMFLPYIIQPTRVNSNSKIINDNIFSNIISTDIISDSLIATISDHLPQFLIAPEVFRNSPSSKSNYFERDWGNFNQKNFILDYFSVNWKNILNLEQNDINHSLQSFFDSMNDLFKIHAPYAPYKKVKKYKLKFKQKPWISSSLQKSISRKNSIFKKYINEKDPHIKEELHQKYKNYRNNIAILMKKSKQNCFTKYFETNIKNLKNTWKGIKSIILKNPASNSPDLLNFNIQLTNDPLKIANVFNNYFSSIGEKTRSKTRISNKNYTDYLHGENFNSFFITPTDSQEVFPLYPYSVITNPLVQIVYQQEY